MSDDDNTRKQRTVQFRVEMGEYWLMREWGAKQKLDCPDCDGTGKIGTTRRGMPVEKVCGRCGGTGIYIPPWSSAVRDRLVEEAAEMCYPGKTIEQAVSAALRKARRKGLASG